MIATIGEWRSWKIASDADGDTFLVEDERSAGWDDEWWGMSCRDFCRRACKEAGKECEYGPVMELNERGERL